MVVGTWSLKGYLFIVFFDQNRYFSKSRNSEFEIDYSNLFKNIDFDQAIMCCKNIDFDQNLLTCALFLRLISALTNQLHCLKWRSRFGCAATRLPNPG